MPDFSNLTEPESLAEMARVVHEPSRASAPCALAPLLVQVSKLPTFS